METIIETPDKFVLRMGANISLANAIRRSLSKVKVLAVDEVEIFKNDSALYDEVVAHRIGLLPLNTNKKMGAKTKMDLKLQKSGPGIVYAKDFVGEAKIIYGGMPITLLEKGQEIELIATARLGCGQEHAKFMPGLGFYRYLFEVKKGNQKIEEILKSSKGFVHEENKKSWIVDLNEAEEDAISKIDSNAIKESDEIIFVVESFGQMTAKEVFVNAVDALCKNLKEFEKLIK